MQQGGELLIEEQEVVEFDLDGPATRATDAHAVDHARGLHREDTITFGLQTQAQLRFGHAFDGARDNLPRRSAHFTNEFCHLNVLLLAEFAQLPNKRARRGIPEGLLALRNLTRSAWATSRQCCSDLGGLSN